MPRSESFINGIINEIQSLLDRAQQIFEQKLGLRSATLQFQSEVYSNEQKKRDFIRQVCGAFDALLDFRHNLTGTTSDRRISVSFYDNASDKNADILNKSGRSTSSQSNINWSTTELIKLEERNIIVFISSLNYLYS